MANPLRGEASIEVDGRTYELRFNWNAAAEFESATKKPIGEAVAEVFAERVSAVSLRGMLWAGLRAKHRGVTLDEAGRMLDVIGREAALRVMGTALRYFYPEIDPEARPEDPRTPPPSTT